MIEYLDLQLQQIAVQEESIVKDQQIQELNEEKEKIQKIQKIKKETEQQYNQIKLQYQIGDKSIQSQYNEAKLVKKQIQNYVRNFIESSMKKDQYHDLFFPIQDDYQQDDDMIYVQPQTIEQFIQKEQNLSKSMTQTTKLQELQSTMNLTKQQQQQTDDIPSVSQLLYQQQSRSVIKSEQDQLQDALELQKSILNSQDPKLKQILDIIPPVVDNNQSIDDLQKAFNAKLEQSKTKKSTISINNCNLLDEEQINLTSDVDILRHQMHLLQQDNIQLKTRNKFLEATVKTQDESLNNLRQELQQACSNNSNEELAEKLKENLELKHQINDQQQQFEMYKQQVKQDISVMKQHFIDQVNNYRQLLQIQKLNIQPPEFRRSYQNIQNIQKSQQSNKSDIVFECSVEQKGEDLEQQMNNIDQSTSQNLAVSQLQIESQCKSEQLQALKNQLSLLKQSNIK